MSSEAEEFESASEGEFDENEMLPTIPQSTENISEPKTITTTQEAKVETSTTSNPTTKATNENQNNSWSAWGNFLTNAITAVQESLESDMSSLVTTAKDLGEGLKKVTEEGVEKIYHQLEASPQDKKDENKEDGHEEGSRTGEVREVATRRLLQSTETVLGAIDKTFDFTSDLLGNAVISGYKTIEKAKLPEKLTETVTQVQHTEMIQNSKQVGETLISHGLTALEAIGSVIGKNAARSLLETRQMTRNAVDSGNVISHSGQDMEIFWENNCGNAHLQALEMLSMEAGLKLEAHADIENENIQKSLQEMENILNMDQLIDNSKEAKESKLKTDQGVLEAKEFLGKIGIQNHRQILAMKDVLLQSEESLSQINTETKEENDLKTLKTLLNQSMADITEKACEQLLRTAEIFLMLIAEEKMKKPEEKTSIQQVFVFANALKDLVFLFGSEIFLYTQTCRSKIEPFDELKDLVEQNFETCCGYLKEAVYFNIPIMKLLLISLSENKK